MQNRLPPDLFRSRISSLASLPIFRDTNVGTYDADAIALTAFLGIPGRNASAVDCLVLRYFPNKNEDTATVFV